MLIAARDNGYLVKDQEQIVLETVGQYCTAMREFAAMENLAVWYSHIDIEALLRERSEELKPAAVKRTKRALAKARTRDNMFAFSKLAEAVDGGMRIIDQSPLIAPIEALAQGEAAINCLRVCISFYASTARHSIWTGGSCLTSSS